jgi:hypothetical protein
VSALGKVFRANYGGQCSGCFEPFDEGDQIRYYFDEIIGEECCGADIESLEVSEQEDITIENFLTSGDP